MATFNSNHGVIDSLHTLSLIAEAQGGTVYNGDAFFVVAGDGRLLHGTFIDGKDHFVTVHSGDVVGRGLIIQYDGEALQNEILEDNRAQSAAIDAAKAAAEADAAARAAADAATDKSFLRDDSAIAGSDVPATERVYTLDVARDFLRGLGEFQSFNLLDAMDGSITGVVNGLTASQRVFGTNLTAAQDAEAQVLQIANGTHNDRTLEGELADTGTVGAAVRTAVYLTAEEGRVVAAGGQVEIGAAGSQARTFGQDEILSILRGLDDEASLDFLSVVAANSGWGKGYDGMGAADANWVLENYTDGSAVAAFLNTESGLEALEALCHTDFSADEIRLIGNNIDVISLVSPFGV